MTIILKQKKMLKWQLKRDLGSISLLYIYVMFSKKYRIIDKLVWACTRWI